MKIPVLLLFGALLPATPSARAADPPPRGLPRGSAEVRATWPAPGTLETLFGGREESTRCLSAALLTALSEPEAQRAAVRTLRAPDIPDPQIWTDGGPFRIHYSTRPGSPHAVGSAGETGGSVAPRYVARVAEALRAAAAVLSEDLGLQPAAVPQGVEVYLAEPGLGVDGYAIPLQGDPGDAPRGLLVLSPSLAEPGRSAAHHLAHLVVLGYSTAEPSWWHEATAAWAEWRASGPSPELLAALGADMARPEQGLGVTDPQRMAGGLLFPAFLGMGESPPHSLRMVWEECAAVPGDNLTEALHLVAGDTGWRSLADLLRAFYAAWVAEPAGRDRLAATLGTPLPVPGLAAEVRSYPWAGPPSGVILAPLGAAFLSFSRQPGPGGIDLEVASEGPGWDGVLLARSATDGEILAVPARPGPDGWWRLRLPWESLGDALLLLTHTGRDQEAVRIGIRASHDPAIPFDLVSLGARREGAAVLLEWSTASEADLFGWNLYRSRQPHRGFVRVNRFPVPAGGSERHPAGYSFLDAAPGDGRVWYLLEGVTREGFTVTTHTVTALPASSG